MLHEANNNDRTIKRKVLLRLAGSPATIVPLMLGMTIMTASWTLGWNEGFGFFAGLAGLLGGTGMFFTRLLLQGDKVSRKVLAEQQAEAQQQRQLALDELDQRLSSADNDPRPETALRDLRALAAAFEGAAHTSSGLNARSVFDIRTMVAQLFDQCVHSLGQTERLWETAQQLQTAAAQQPILQHREKVIADIQATIKQLSDTLVALQNLGGGERSTAELNRLRDELDQSLAVAKKVEERLQDLVREADVSARPLHLNEQPKGDQL